jgi:hypothetical protein
MQRCIEDDGVKETIWKWKVVKFSAYASEANGTLLHQPWSDEKPIPCIEINIGCHDIVTMFSEAVGKPAISRSKIEDPC